MIRRLTTLRYRTRHRPLLLLLLRLTVILGLGAPSGLAIGQGYQPDEAAGHMTVADGLEVRLFASEPMVRQPVAIEFDDRGRLWVIQYLQYPNPAGLNRVAWDRYSRTTYDRLPEPPPHGPVGADRITILEDANHDGVADSSHDFLTGLNLATGLAFGNQGVYVLAAPYLLFYADRDSDDRPDGDPEVLLTGFGIEDAHSVANSLTWGPDGWLYGCQGSTVTANIRGIEFQQGVWRYHPRTKRFELFYEGGGNTWGLDFDRTGNLFASTNVGGFVMLHGVQGGYYWKSFGKHGALHNPFAFGYFDHVVYDRPQGGHVTDGGIFYQGTTFPDRFRERYVAANLLSHDVYWHELEPQGSTFKARHGGVLLRSNDTWFAPSDVTLGPDGAIYVTDWHDQRTAHPDPDAKWDDSNGRIFRIQARGAPAVETIDLATLNGPALVAMLANENGWFARRARRLIGERQEAALAGRLRDELITADHQSAVGEKERWRLLEQLWALHASAGLDDSLASKLIDSSDPAVRRWTIRLLGDMDDLSVAAGELLLRNAGMEMDPTVLSQLASTARRLPPAIGLEIASAIARRDVSAADPQIPLLTWWAIEPQSIDSVDRVLSLFASPEAWNQPLVRDEILPRLMKRYLLSGEALGGQTAGRLFDTAPIQVDRERMLATLDATLPAVRLTESLTPLALRIGNWYSRDPRQPMLIRVAARLGHEAARSQAMQRVSDSHVDESERVLLVDLLSDLGTEPCQARLVELASDDSSDAVRAAAIDRLARFTQRTIAESLVRIYPSLEGHLRDRAAACLCARPQWAALYLAAIDEKTIAADQVPLDAVAQIARFNDEELNARVRKLWGNVQAATPEEKLADVRRFNNDLRAAEGHLEQGEALFKEHCGTCHKLFGQGNTVGPDLTAANRRNRDELLRQIVYPSEIIRKEFLNYTLVTKDGRVLGGLIAEQTPTQITLLGAKNERTIIPLDQVDTLEVSSQSLMPERLLEKLSPQELRDLFRYLQAQSPPQADEQAAATP